MFSSFSCLKTRSRNCVRTYGRCVDYKFRVELKTKRESIEGTYSKIYLSKMEEKSKKMFGINGMEQNDTGALTPEQQQKLNEFKVKKCVSKEKR